MRQVDWLWLAGYVAIVLSAPVACWYARRRSRRHVEAGVELARDVPVVRIRPRGPDRAGRRGRVDRWLAADSPTPTAGWWHNGGLIVDGSGAALVDAAGLRHALPQDAAVLVCLTAPRALLLLDDRENLLVRLPPGFAAEDLRRLCVAAGWRDDPTAGWGRDTGRVLDLRQAVVDRAARDPRFTARRGPTTRRQAH